MYRKIKLHPFLSIIGFQLIIISIAFNKIIFQASKYLFINEYDGLKNYFTFFEFIKQKPNKKGIFHFEMMNYPFGEYVFFTDNTPLFSVPLRWINHYFFNIEDYLVLIHNFLFISGIFLTSIFCYLLFKRWVKSIWINILLSVGIAWINPQILRLGIGHFNLSFSFLLVATLLLIILIFENWEYGNKFKMFKLSASIFTLIFLAGFIHFYYLPIIGLPILVFTTLLFLSNWVTKKNPLIFKLSSIYLSVGLALLLVFFIVKSIDNYKDLRLSRASGYNFQEWNFSPEAIYSSYGFNSISPFIKTCKKSIIHYESYGFIGNASFYTFIAIGIFLLYFVFKRKIKIKSAKSWFLKNQLFLILFFTAIAFYSISAGNYLYFCKLNIGFDNVFSIFYFLEKKIDLISQFRCLGRFSWISFWIVNLLAIVSAKWIFYILYNRDKDLANVFLIVIMIIFLIDVKDSIKNMNSLYAENIFHNGKLESKFEELSEINFEDYQAILTIPFVQVGSENYNFTIDDQKEWTDYWMPLVSYSGLPTFNTKMSRTAESQTKAQFDLFTNTKIPSSFLHLLDDKKILVVYNPSSKDNYNLKMTENAISYFLESDKIIDKHDMEFLLKDKNNVFLYEWVINNKELDFLN